MPSPTAICGSASRSAVAAVDATVRAKGQGNSLTKGGVLADPASGMWLVVAPFEGPAGEGEGALGIWATDPTLKAFAGTVYAVSDTAANWSTAPRSVDVPFEPQDLPVLRCLPSKRPWHNRSSRDAPTGQC